MFEHYRQPLLSRQAFLMRMLRCAALSVILLTATLVLGTAGFHHFERFSWIDAFLGSVTIMTGQGLAGILTTWQGKFFTALYALFSTLVFFTILGILISPLLHRFLHRLHLETDKK